MKTPPLLISFYLPQYHPIPENDEWWGKGFTEWTNTAKAKPLFKNHYQPHIPADLGFYDLRLPEARQAQADMAAEYGIGAFCYYHYWFGGRRILERPFNEVLNSGEPNFPFCLCWANETWTGIWHGNPDKILIEQNYPGAEDHKNHFDTLLPAFRDPRYVRFGGVPIFLIYKPQDIPDMHHVADQWREMAAKAGLGGIHLIGQLGAGDLDPQKYGLDGYTYPNLPVSWPPRKQFLQWLLFKYRKSIGLPRMGSYAKYIKNYKSIHIEKKSHHPCVIHSWDNTPRSGQNGFVLEGSTPDAFRILFSYVLSSYEEGPLEQQIIFLKSWNEWAEGNSLEPDLKYGTKYLKVIEEQIKLRWPDIS